MTQARFEALQAKWRSAQTKAHDLRFELQYHYGDMYRVRAPKAKMAKADKASAAEERAQDAIFTYLEANSPRSWRSGVPCYWVCDKLTYADAITAGQMSVIPPVSYGGMPSDSIRFAGPVQAKEPVCSW